MPRDIVAGLDVGTTKVAAVVGQVGPEGLTGIIGLGTAPCHGMRKGVVVDIEATVKSIREAVSKAQRMAGVNIESVYLGIAGGHISSLNNRGVVAVTREDREITAEDVNRVLEAARLIHIPPDREIIHVLPRGYIVDGFNGIRDPVGLLGTRLEVEANIVTTAINSMQNLMRCVYRAGLGVEEVVLLPLVAGEAVLEPAEKDLGVILVDMGGGTTDVALFEGGSLWFTASIPLGGDHITSDIAVGLRTPIPHAESIKIKHGWALTSCAPDEVLLEVAQVGGHGTRQVSERVLASIIEPRLQEIFGLVAREVKRSGYTRILPGGVVLTGGAAQMRGLPELAAAELDLPVRVGAAEVAGGLKDMVRGPGCAATVGLVQYAARLLAQEPPVTRTLWGGVWERFRTWLGNLLSAGI